MRRFFSFLIRVIITLLIIPWLYALCLIKINPPITITQIDSMLEGYAFNRDYLSSDQIPVDAKWAVVAAEDQRFALHNGFDLDEIQKVYNTNKSGDKIRGASTISQQLAKNIFLWQKRSWVRKGLETYCTLVLETVLSKNRILEIYLNSVEMGKGTFGIEAAAKYYYQTSASQLTTQQICNIIAALPSPKTYRVNPPGDYVSRRSKWIQRQIQNLRGDKHLEEIMSSK